MSGHYGQPAFHAMMECVQAN